MPELFVPLLAAIGGIALVSILLSALMRPWKNYAVTAYARVETPEQLTAVIQGYSWARMWGGGDYTLGIVADSLNPEAARMAELYCNDEPCAKLIWAGTFTFVQSVSRNR